MRPQGQSNDRMSCEPSLARVLAGAAEARTVTIGESVSMRLILIKAPGAQVPRNMSHNLYRSASSDWRLKY
jgi:hypothetical protein